MGGEIKSSGNTYTVIRVSRIQSQQQSQPLQQEQSVMNNSKQQPAVEITSIDDSVSSSTTTTTTTTTTTNVEMQEEMYSRYGMELQHLADMGFENFAVLFPILKAMIPVPASETDNGEVNIEQINEVVTMLVARNS